MTHSFPNDALPIFMAATAKSTTSHIGVRRRLVSSTQDHAVSAAMTPTMIHALRVAGTVSEGRPNRSLAVLSRKVVSPGRAPNQRSEEHTSELKSLMRISYAVF